MPGEIIHQMRKIDLQVKPQYMMKDCNGHRTIQWKKSLPFLINPRAILIHRVRFAVSHLRDWIWSHDSITYWCNNHGRGLLTDDPPKNRLLCAYCEAKAIAAGEPSAHELCGRHVCIGTLKPVRRCCHNTEN